MGLMDTLRSMFAPAGAVPAVPPPPAKLPAPVSLCKWAPDARSERNMSTLEPITAALVRELLRRLAGEGFTFVVTSGTRTFEEQAALYAQGRSKPGKIVTKARPGSSWHNFGVAADLTLFHGSRPVWDGAEYDRMGQLAKELGLEWGGSWKTFKDRPHVQRRLGLTLAEARKKFPKGRIA